MELESNDMDEMHIEKGHTGFATDIITLSGEAMSRQKEWAERMPNSHCCLHLL